MRDFVLVSEAILLHLRSDSSKEAPPGKGSDLFIVAKQEYINAIGALASSGKPHITVQGYSVRRWGLRADPGTRISTTIRPAI